MKNWQVNVAVAHGGKHHLYETCVAYQKIDRFAGFLTAQFAVNRALPDMMCRMPVAKVRWLGKNALRYHDPRISNDVSLYAPNPGKKLALRVLGGRHFFEGPSFGKAVAEWAVRRQVAVHSHVTGSQEIFERIGKEGLPCLLEMYQGDRGHGRALIERELEELGLPHGEDALTSYGFEQQKVDRCQRECELADFVYCISPFVYDSIRQSGVPESKLVFAPLGAIPLKTEPAFCERREGEPLRVAFVGEEGVRKGLRYLIEAAEKLRPHVQLHVYGMSSFTAPGLKYNPDVVVFHGFTYKPEMLAQLTTMHVGSLPSLFEGCAIGVYDCLGSGLPVIVTHSAGTLVEDQKEAFVVPERDSNAIAIALEKLLRDEDLRRTMSAAALKYVRECTWDRYYSAVAAPLLKMSNP